MFVDHHHHKNQFYDWKARIRFRIPQKLMIASHNLTETQEICCSLSSPLISKALRCQLTVCANCKEICNRKSATTSVTVLTQKTAITWVTPSGTKARRCSHENRERNSPASR